MKHIHLIFFVLLIIFAHKSFSQTDTSAKSLKISGYIQVDYQHFFVPDSVGATTPWFATYSGGNFINRFTTDRFSLRRGRLKFQHQGQSHEGVMSFDITEKGIGIRDFYIKYNEPFTKYFYFTAGMFNRPFGREIALSSSERETPERSRAVQTILPHERDLGVMIGFKAPEESKINFLSAQFAMVNGNGTAVETDNYKDMIGRLGLDFHNSDESFKFGAGVSFYNGNINHVYEPVDTVASGTNRKFYIYNFQAVDDPTGRTTMAFVLDTAASYATGQTGGKVERNYIGFDAEMSFETPFGEATVRGEFMSGTQPAAINYRDVEQAYIIYNGMTTTSPTGPFLGVSWPIYDQPQPYNPVAVKPTEKNHHTFVRKFSGGYFYWVQNLFKTQHQFVIKYDWYDPNTEAEGTMITYDADNYLNDTSYIKPYLSVADVKFTTLGIGLNIALNTNTRICFYYEHPQNEITALKPYEGDINLGRTPSPGYDRDINDDVFTIRLQYKF